MLSKKIHILIASAFLGSIISLTGCSQSTSTEPVKNQGNEQTNSTAKKVMNIGLRSDPTAIDPKMSNALVDRYVQNSIYDKLFDLDPNGKLVPMLVDSYEISQDGKVYTFKLKKGIKFQDGTDFNADAVRFNIERYKEEVSTRRSELSFVKNVTVMDPSTVKIELSEPFSPFISVLADRSGMMVSPEAVKKYGADFNNHPVGTGPYIFVEHVQGDHILLKKNEAYWNGKVKIDELNFKAFVNGTAAVQNLKSGQLDLIETIPTKEIANIKQDPNLTLIDEPGLGYDGFYLNAQAEPLNNKYLRQAINKAIDREALVKVVYDGYAKPANAPFAPSSFAYGDSDKIGKPDPEEIKALLQKGGKPDGFTFKLQITPSPVYEQLATVIQNMLKPYNIQLQIEKMEAALVTPNGTSGKFQGLEAIWSGRLDPDQSFYAFVVTGQPNNWSRISNQNLDDLAKKARFESDQGKRKELYQQAMEIVHDEAPYVYLVHSDNLFGISKKIKGFNYYPDGVFRTATLDKE